PRAAAAVLALIAAGCATAAPGTSEPADVGGPASGPVAPSGPTPDGATPGSDPAPAGGGASAADRPFADITAATGLDFRHVNGMTGRYYFVEMMGAGGALLDYDGDGDLDVYAAQGHALDLAVPTAGPGTPPPPDHPTGRLYRNRLEETRGGGTAALRFEDVTEASGLVAAGYGMGAAPADYDNDGDVDLYLVNWGPNQLWRNDGDGTFTDVTAASGAGDPGWSAGASWFDYDRDGWLDLAVVNYDAYTLENDHPCFASGSGRRDYCGPKAYPPEPDRLLHNRGDGTFEDVTLSAGIAAADGPALGVVAADFNGDGWQDLYVANDAADNQMWINVDGERFRDEAPMNGTAVNGMGIPEGSMGVVAADIEGDGDEDLFVVNIQTESNTLYVNDGQGLFEDRSRPSGLGPPAFPFTGFGALGIDYDNDGRPDFFVANGEVRVIEAQAAEGDTLPLRQANQLYRNVGDGRFETIPEAESGVADVRDVGRGAAMGDLDNDGDSDIVVFNNNGPARVLANQVGQRQPWLGLRLVGAGGRRDMLGARAALVDGGRPRLWRRAHTDGSYLAGNDPRVLFGLGGGTTFDAVHVWWPDGTVEAWAGLAPGAYHTLVQGEGEQVTAP
ncbi:hypothetical protein DCC79_16205, partial [bacterium]